MLKIIRIPLISHYFLLSLPQITIKTKDMITSINKITPDLQAKLDKARVEHKSGETLCFNTAQDAITRMESI